MSRFESHSGSTRFVGLVAVAIFLALVFPGISVRGARLYDEAHFLLAANTLAQGARGLLSGQSPGQIGSEIHAGGGTLYLAAKPGYIGLVAILGLLLGKVTAVLAHLVSIAGGALAVFATSILARRLFGVRVGLVAGILAATNPLLIHFARLALGVAPAIGLAMAGLALLATARTWRRALMAGLFGAVAFTNHYNVAILLAAGLAGLWPATGKQQRIAVLAGGAGALLLLEIAMQGVGLALRSAYPEFRTFFGELLHNFTAHQVEGGAAISTDGMRGYSPAAWLYAVGVWGIGLNATGIAAVIGMVWLRREPAEDAHAGRMVWMLTLVPLAFWTLYPWKVERAFATAMPGFCIAGAVAVARFAELWLRPDGDRQPGMRWAAWLPAITCATCGAMISGWPVPAERSPFERAVAVNREALESAPAASITATAFHWRSTPLWKWYLGPGWRADGNAPLAAVDFADFGPSKIVGWDPLSATPDAAWSGAGADFATSATLGVVVRSVSAETEGLYGFSRRVSVDPASDDTPPSRDLRGDGSRTPPASEPRR